MPQNVQHKPLIATQKPKKEKLREKREAQPVACPFDVAYNKAQMALLTAAFPVRRGIAGLL